MLAHAEADFRVRIPYRLEEVDQIGLGRSLEARLADEEAALEILDVQRGVHLHDPGGVLAQSLGELLALADGVLRCRIGGIGLAHVDRVILPHQRVVRGEASGLPLVVERVDASTVEQRNPRQPVSLLRHERQGDDAAGGGRIRRVEDGSGPDHGVQLRRGVVQPLRAGLDCVPRVLDRPRARARFLRKDLVHDRIQLGEMCLERGCLFLCRHRLSFPGFGRCPKRRVLPRKRRGESGPGMWCRTVRRLTMKLGPRDLAILGEGPTSRPVWPSGVRTLSLSSGRSQRRPGPAVDLIRSSFL
ncbi:hypothetical protein D9M72_299490 [compost metagenome]